MAFVDAVVRGWAGGEPIPVKQPVWRMTKTSLIFTVPAVLFAVGGWQMAGNPERERWFTRGACAEVLIDAGAIVTQPVHDSLIESRAKGLLQLFQRKGLLPRTLKFLAALGDCGPRLVTH